MSILFILLPCTALAAAFEKPQKARAYRKHPRIY